MAARLTEVAQRTILSEETRGFFVRVSALIDAGTLNADALCTEAATLVAGVAKKIDLPLDEP